MNKIIIITAITIGTLTLGTAGFVGWAVADLSAKQAALTEAVNMVEEAARTIQEDMEILRNIADREECYENRGEWSDEYGCHLEEL